MIRFRDICAIQGVILLIVGAMVFSEWLAA